MGAVVEAVVDVGAAVERGAQGGRDGGGEAVAGVAVVEQVQEGEGGVVGDGRGGGGVDQGPGGAEVGGGDVEGGVEGVEGVDWFFWGQSVGRSGRRGIGSCWTDGREKGVGVEWVAERTLDLTPSVLVGGVDLLVLGFVRRAHVPVESVLQTGRTVVVVVVVVVVVHALELRLSAGQCAIGLDEVRFRFRHEPVW